MKRDFSRAIYRMDSADAERSGYARCVESYQRSLAILRMPRPDTFLGHKTQEPFPPQDDQR